MKSYMKVLIFIAVYLIIVQLTLGKAVSDTIIYNYRMDYDLLKDRPRNLDIVLEHISNKIKKENIKDYIVILGDSVAFSSPGPADKSIGYYMEEHYSNNGKNIKVFNLALPSNQIGDIYTILLEMDKYNISRDNLIINIIYAGFVDRNPDPPPVFWFSEQFKKLDTNSFEYVRDNLIINKKIQENSIINVTNIKEEMFDKFAITKYKNIIRANILSKMGRYETTWINETGQPWYEKEFLADLLKEPMYQKEFSDEKFIMNEANYQIYFLNKIIDLQRGKNTLFFLAGANKELMKEETNKQGYIDNVKLIDDYFRDKSVEYINLMGKIDYDLYSDHVHLIPEGYKKLSDILINKVADWFN